jgi:hypothetical protein
MITRSPSWTRPERVRPGRGQLTVGVRLRIRRQDLLDVQAVRLSPLLSRQSVRKP